MNKHETAKAAAKILSKKFPSPKTELNHKNEYQLAVAVMLSAQTTDKKVNEVTPELFKKFKSWKELAGAKFEDVRKVIKQVNFYKGKGERIVNAAKTILSDFGGELPKKIDKLIKIPGIARKSANVIQQELWDISEGIVVDTHVTRVSQRLNLTTYKDAEKIEKELMELVPKKYWRNFSGAMVFHGRYTCTARNPNCKECELKDICPSAFKTY